MSLPESRPAVTGYPKPIRRTSIHRPWVPMLALLTALPAGCDRIKTALNPPSGDPQWQSDSALLASTPNVLFQATASPRGTRIVPMATVGESGFRTLGFGARGWRAFDLQYLAKGERLVALRAGQPAGDVAMTRGMWDPTALDTLPCPNVVPAGIADVPSGTRFLTTRRTTPLKPVTPLGGSELQQVLSTIPTLVTPTLGVGGAMLSRYTRAVHTAATGATARPTIIVIYDDPEMLPDSAQTMGQRPRHLVVVLDRGIYGYRPSFTYSTIGNRRPGVAPRYRFKDYVDVDGDGRAELVFGVQNEGAELATVVLRYENESWREILKHEGNRCQF